MENKRTYIVTEMCPHCEREVEIHGWNTDIDGFEATCPYCGNRLMLCDECQHQEVPVSCDYCKRTDRCRMRKSRKLWMRLGVSAQVTRDEEKALFDGDVETLIRLADERRFELDGDSYIPECVISQFNRDNGMDYHVQDVDFEL